ncbi:MAG: prepilin-type N-terminal cleavage/methylation domain-containing protein [Verrucomicrobia bacterium]|nr:prepilin-type N-terminal cleavage/methylation domain-containing protein [Verrucomicrobiota bacterium]
MSEVRGQRAEYAPRSLSRAKSRGTLHALRAFTLVELLVVISIIALLLGIIVPSYFSIREKAKYTKAKVTVKNLETAFKAYLDHYRTWPSAFGPGTAQEIDESVVNILRGDKIAGNLDGIAFYEFETTNSSDGALDAWYDPYNSALKTYYWVQVDDNYDNKIDLAGGQKLYRAVIVWSPGADRTNDYGTGDDVKSWD